MSTASRVPELIDAFLAALAGAPGLETVRVVDGPIVSDSAASEWAFIGFDADPEGEVMTAQTIQEWAGIGARAKNETITLTSAILVQRSSTDVRAARVRAFEIFAAVEAAVRADSSLGLPPPTVCSISPGPRLTTWPHAACGPWSCGESTAGRAKAGKTAGATDAKTAAGRATAAGMPSGRPIYFAVVFDATPGDQTAINAYLDGAASVLGRSRMGIYGGYYPVKRALDAGKATWAWQTIAWSGGQWDARAVIRQGAQATISGVSCNLNTVTANDYGQWMPGKTPSVEDDVALTQDDIDKVAAAVVTKLLAGGGALEDSDLKRIWSADVIPAAAPPYNNTTTSGRTARPRTTRPGRAPTPSTPRSWASARPSIESSRSRPRSQPSTRPPWRPRWSPSSAGSRSPSPTRRRADR
ncbi:glycoside hydrolase domain-containing protein [Streptomyces griseofuscus]|uniref:glycoside hydrolase domain-containing protein n=1 Tax=Streptomyces griseofuscus TaxID=146922 RepID=UPI00341FC15E